MLKGLPIFIGIAAIIGCTANSQVKEEKNIQDFPVTELISKDTVLFKEYVSDIHAHRNVEIRARVQGYLEKILVDEGKEVEKGQVLFKIHDEEYNAALTSARATLKSAIAEAKGIELEISRVKMLVDKKIVSPSELELAKAKYEAAKAKIEEAKSAELNAEIKLSQTVIRAPFNGTIDRIPFKVGSLITEGTLLSTVLDNSFIYSYFNVSESEYLSYIKNHSMNPGEKRQEVELILANGSRYPYKGEIETMESQFDSNTGTIAFRAKFSNKDNVLKHGASGKVVLTEVVENALLLPQKSVFEIQDKNYVFVVNKNNKVEMKSFAPSNRFSHFYIVKDGLKTGDRIVYEGIQNIKDGMLIRPQLFAMDSILLQTIKG